MYYHFCSSLTITPSLWVVSSSESAFACIHRYTIGSPEVLRIERLPAGATRIILPLLMGKLVLELGDYF